MVAVLVGPDALRDGTAVLAPGPVAAAVALGLLWRALAAARWVLLARALALPLALGRGLRGVPAQRAAQPGAARRRAGRRGPGAPARRRRRAAARRARRRPGARVRAGRARRRGRRGRSSPGPELRLVARGADGRTVAAVAVVLLLVAALGVVLWAPVAAGSGAPPAAARPGPARPGRRGRPVRRRAGLLRRAVPRGGPRDRAPAARRADRRRGPRPGRARRPPDGGGPADRLRLGRPGGRRGAAPSPRSAWAPRPGSPPRSATACWRWCRRCPAWSRCSCPGPPAPRGPLGAAGTPVSRACGGRAPAPRRSRGR